MINTVFFHNEWTNEINTKYCFLRYFCYYDIYILIVENFQKKCLALHDVRRCPEIRSSKKVLKYVPQMLTDQKKRPMIPTRRLAEEGSVPLSFLDEATWEGGIPVCTSFHGSSSSGFQCATPDPLRWLAVISFGKWMKWKRKEISSWRKNLGNIHSISVDALSRN